MLAEDGNRPFHLLCLGAHADDIEIGCGGTILRLLTELQGVSVKWVVFSGQGTADREAEARSAATAFMHGAADGQIDVLAFRDGYFPFYGTEIKDYFERLKRDFAPSLVLTHWKEDAHQDHRLIGELTHNTFRDHLILEYEIPKYDGDLSNPNVFVPLGEAQIQRKTELLKNHFLSQQTRGWFTEDTFLAMARLRGIGCNAPEKFAEAFYARKIIF